MGLEAGGYAEKLGNRYEANWVALQYLLLLEEKISAVTVEPIGDDEEGVDVIIENINGDKEYHQCKSSKADNEFWSLSDLQQAKILTKAQSQIQREIFEFHVVSPLPSKIISDLGDSALNTTLNPKDFYGYQIKTSRARLKSFNQLCGYLNLDIANTRDLGVAIKFLQRFKVTLHVIDKNTNLVMEYKASTMFSDHPGKLIHFLKNYPVEHNKLRHRITAIELLNDLKEYGFEQRIVPEDNRISPVLERISEDFSQSIKPFLIGQSLIKRPEFETITQSLNESGVILIKAEAGMGKSALLLDIHEDLEKRGVISVPIRLDRNKVEGNADKFGESIGLPFSPPLCLRRYAAGTKIVIILDQLDAIRWTATHSNQALQVCQEVVRQVISLRENDVNINIILACRNFDLDEDIALSSWINDISAKVLQVEISNLSEETVIDRIKPFEDYSTLAQEKKEILKIPLWLNIYLIIANRIKSAPKFNNKLELVKRFWEDRLEEVKNHNISLDEAKGLIDEIVILMSSKSSLSVSENLVTINSSQTINALLSVGVLNRQNNRLSFRHQALFDYQVGKRLFSLAAESSISLIQELGKKSQQTLTKREHLKYALNMLLEYGQSEFCNSVLAILINTEIRFHLKYLAFNSIREIKEIKKPAKDLIENIVGNKEILPFFLNLSCPGNEYIVKYLLEKKYISNWLDSEDNDLIEKTLFILSSVSEKIPESIINEISVRLGKSDQWNKWIYSTLPMDLEKDSDRVFELRKELIALGCNVHFIHWRKISKNNPERALDLIEIMLFHYKDAFYDNRYGSRLEINKISNRDTWSKSELDEIVNIAEKVPFEAVNRLLKIVVDFVGESEDGNSAEFNWLYKDKYSRYDAVQSITHGVFLLIEKSTKNLCKEPDTLLDCISVYFDNNSMVVNYLIAKALVFLPIKYSDLVIEWLLREPKTRLCCGNTHIEPSWVLPGSLVKKFSPHCTEDNFRNLEKAIYYFGSSYELDEIKRRLNLRREGLYYSYWGETQHFLLPNLSAGRLSGQSKQMIEVLKRKFEKYYPNDFSSNFESIGAWCRSPLPLPNKLSDNAWRKLILTSLKKLTRKKWTKISQDVALESSVEQFSESLSIATKNQPTRFAKLALSLPSYIHAEYIRCFYNGFSEIDNRNVNENYKEKWSACEPNVIEEVVEHFKERNHECEHALLRMLDKNIERNGFSENVIGLLIQLAKNAKDPQEGKLEITISGESDNPNEVDSHTLQNNAINCSRGIAFKVLCKLLWKSGENENKLRDLIQIAIDDPHPAVKIAAIDMLLPTANHNYRYAQEKFIELCNKDLRMACADGSVYFFNSAFSSESREDFILLIQRMIKSEFNEVKKEGAREVFARWFFNGLFEVELEVLWESDSIYMEGIASVVAQLLSEDKFHEYIHKITPIYEKLVNAEKEEILITIGRPISSSNYWNKSISKELFAIFVRSNSVKKYLYELFIVLENYVGSLLNYKNEILNLIDNITSTEYISEAIESMNIRDTSLLKVLQRMYDEAIDDEDSEALEICLDIWDKLLKSNIYSAINATKELDKGLLS